MVERKERFLNLALGSILVATTLCRPWGGESTQREQAPAGPVAPDSVRARGEQVFLSNCSGCHPGGGAGIGPALNNRPIPESLIRSQVRNGRGIMPAFPQDRITDEQLDELVAYVTTLYKPDKGQ